jgi:hypothetical protein
MAGEHRASDCHALSLVTILPEPVKTRLLQVGSFKGSYRSAFKRAMPKGTSSHKSVRLGPRQTNLSLRVLRPASERMDEKLR